MGYRPRIHAPYWTHSIGPVLPEVWADDYSEGNPPEVIRFDMDTMSAVFPYNKHYGKIWTPVWMRISEAHLDRDSLVKEYRKTDDFMYKMCLQSLILMVGEFSALAALTGVTDEEMIETLRRISPNEPILGYVDVCSKYRREELMKEHGTDTRAPMLSEGAL